MADGDVCGICLESLTAPSQGRQWLGCSHAFHELCILEMRRFGLAGRCPTCRRASSDLKPIQDLVSEAFRHIASKAWADAFRCASEAVEIAGEDLEVLSEQPIEYVLGRFFLEGKGVERNVDKAVELLDKARGRGHAMAIVPLGKLHLHGQHPEPSLEMALKLFEEARSRGDPDASVGLAFMYEEGRGVQQNVSKAMELLKEACDNDDPFACTMLGSKYRTGDGVEQNTTKARELLEVARSQGQAEASQELAEMYISGEGVEDNAMTAVELFLEARSRGGTRASFPLSLLYGNGAGVDQDVRRGWQFMEEALEAGDPRASKYMDDLSGSDDDTAPNLGEVPDAKDGSAEARATSTTDGFQPHMQTLAAGSSTDPAMDPLSRPLDDMEAALEESVRDADARAVAWNSPLSDAILRSRLTPERVVVLEVTRTPRSLRDALFSSPELEAARNKLESQGLALELDSGAKMFVKPSQYAATLRAVENLDLKPRHVVVSTDLEEDVLGVIINATHTRVKRRRIIAKMKPLEAEVKRSFIHLEIPSSLHSDPSTSVRPATH